MRPALPGGLLALQQRVVALGFLARLPRLFRRTAAVFRNRIAEHLFQARGGLRHILLGNVAARHRPIDETAGAQVGRVGMRPFAVPQRRGSPLVQRHMRERIHIVQAVAHRRHLAALVLYLHAAQHQQVVGGAVVIEAVAPGLLRLAQAVDPLPEEERVVAALVPAAARGEHIAVFPEIDVRAEIRLFGIGIVVEQRRPHEHGIREHIDVAGEGEETAGVGIGPLVALDDLPVGAHHRGAAAEDRETVLRIVVQHARAQDVVLPVAQLDHRSAELGQVLIDQVVQFPAGQHRFALKQLDVAEAVDDLVLHVPEGRVAGEIGAVVQESGFYGLARHLSIRLHLLEITGVEQAYQGIRLPGRGLGRQRQGGEKQRRTEDQSSFLTLRDHPCRENSQSPNRGSMMI